LQLPNQAPVLNDAAWQGLMENVHAACLEMGSWGGEVRELRDALGAKRMSRRVEQEIRERLADAGYEIEGDSQAEGSIAYEGLEAIISPAGARELAATVEAMLPDIRFWDANTGDPPWRDYLIAVRVVGRFLERQRGPQDA
jgi:hypothetical protein